MLVQIAAVTRLNLQNLGSRAGSSATVVVGSAAVVAVLLGLLAMSAGFRAVLADTAHPDRGQSPDDADQDTHEECRLLRFALCTVPVAVLLLLLTLEHQPQEPKVDAWGKSAA